MPKSQLEKTLLEFEKTSAFQQGILDLSQPLLSVEETDSNSSKKWQGFTIEDINFLRAWVLEKSKRGHIFTVLKLANVHLGTQESIANSAMAQNLVANNTVILYLTHEERPYNSPAMALVEFFRQITTWQEIDLSNNNFIVTESVAILNALQKSKSLRKLNFSRNALGDKGIAELNALLKESEYLSYLNLAFSFCGLKDNQIKLFINNLQINTYLRSLDLHGNPISKSMMDEFEKIFSSSNGNTTLVDINFDYSTIENTDIFLIQKQLIANQEKQKYLHQTLLDPKQLFSEAKNAILQDDPDSEIWVRILLGAQLNTYAHSFAFEQLGYLVEKRVLQFREKLRVERLKLLEPMQASDLNDPEEIKKTQEMFDSLLKRIKGNAFEILEDDINLLKAKKSPDPKVIFIHPDPRAIDIKSDEYKRSLEQAINEWGFIFGPQTNIARWQELLKNRGIDIQNDLQQIEKENDERIKKYRLLETEYKNIPNLLVQLKNKELQRKKDDRILSQNYLVEYEAFAAALDKVRLDINFKDNKGNTLLDYAYQADKSKYIQLLLARGADPLQTNKKTKLSVLQLALKNPAGLNSQLIINYIHQEVVKVWPNFMQAYLPAETAHLQRIKQIVDDYLLKLISKVQLPFLIRLLHQHIDDRIEDCQTYYSQIQLANTHGNAELLKNYNRKLSIPFNLEKILKGLLNYAKCTAKRGWFDRSTLNDEVIVEIEKFLMYLNVNGNHYQTNVHHAETIQVINAQLFDYKERDDERERNFIEERKMRKEEEQKRKEEEQKRKEAEVRAESATARAESERARADALEEELKRLKAQQQNPIIPIGKREIFTPAQEEKATVTVQTWVRGYLAQKELAKLKFEKAAVSNEAVRQSASQKKEVPGPFPN